MKFLQIVSVGIILFFSSVVMWGMFNLVLACFVQYFWNMVCPYMHLPEIGYWQMWAMLNIIAIVSLMFHSNVNLKTND